MNIILTGGLANRLRTMIGFWYVAEEKLEKIIFYWYKDDWCNGNFSDLFEPLKYNNIEIIESPIDYIRNDFRGSSTIPQIIHMYTGVEKKDFWNVEIEYHQRLKPLPFISEEANKYIKSLGEYVAMHIRRTDHIKLAKSKNSYTEDEEFDTFVKLHSNKKIFLATDCLDVQKKYFMAKVYKIISKENVKFIRQTPLQDALIDIIICSKATHFKGSSYSSFSNLIKTFRSIKRE